MAVPKPEPGDRPLIVTLELDAVDQARFEAERRQHFPVRLNRVPAHVSLFHALPGEQLPAVQRTLTASAERLSQFSIEVNGVMQLGCGVAYSLSSQKLRSLRADLRCAWLPWLTPQDRLGFRPHIVVQNKVKPAEAKALHAQLSKAFLPWRVSAAGLLLWHYDGGPWSPAGSFGFAPAPAAVPAAL